MVAFGVVSVASHTVLGIVSLSVDLFVLLCLEEVFFVVIVVVEMLPKNDKNQGWRNK